MKIVLFIVLALVVSTLACAQSTATVGINVQLPVVALLDLAPNGSGITLPMNPPSEAGNPLTISSNNSKWLNFSSAVISGNNRAVTAQIGAGSIPAGLRLRLSLSSYIGGGAGALGASGTSITLSHASQTIVSGIGGSYTGDGVSNGYNLNYSLEIQDYSQLKHDLSTSVVITFTFIDI